MLHEILKGMDNAAEQINENFQNGSIIDSGRNEHGSWVKYGDGRLECTHKMISTSTDPQVWEFPHPFSGETPVVLQSVERATGTLFMDVMIKELTTNTCTWSVSSSSAVTLHLQAIGRWK